MDFSFSGGENLNAMQSCPRYLGTIYRWISKDVSPGMRVLDFGAGSGAFCNRLEEVDGVAVEPDRSFHAALRWNVVESLDEVKGKFDLIFSVNVLEHIEDDRSAVQGLIDRLAPRGVIKVFVPAHNVLFSKMDELVGHYRRYSTKQLVGLFEDAGAVGIKCRHFDPLGFWLALGHKLARAPGRILPWSFALYDTVVFPLSLAIAWISRDRLIGKNLMLEATRDG